MPETANAVTSSTPTRSATAASAAAAQTPSKRATIWLTGRIQHCNEVAKTKDGDPVYETLITTPASDPYSYPPRYCINSTSRLGRRDEDLTIEVEVQCRKWTDQSGRDHYPHYLWAVRG